MPPALRRRYDVYTRIRELGIDLWEADQDLTWLAGCNIALIVFTLPGLTIFGAAKGTGPLTDEDAWVGGGQEAGAVGAKQQIRWLHWALTCGDEGADLNDVLSTVKALGLVVSPGGAGSIAHPRWSTAVHRSGIGFSGADSDRTRPTESIWAVGPASRRAALSAAWTGPSGWRPRSSSPSRRLSPPTSSRGAAGSTHRRRPPIGTSWPGVRPRRKPIAQ